MKNELGGSLTKLRSRVQRLMSCGWVLWVHRVRYSGRNRNAGRCEIWRWRRMLCRQDTVRPILHLTIVTDDRRL
jgi:hypothetical protein